MRFVIWSRVNDASRHSTRMLLAGSVTWIWRKLSHSAIRPVASAFQLMPTCWDWAQLLLGQETVRGGFCLQKLHQKCTQGFHPFTPKGDQFQISLQPHEKYDITVWTTFHSLLRWKMIILPILTTSLIHFSLGRLGECSFWTWECEKNILLTFQKETNKWGSKHHE